MEYIWQYSRFYGTILSYCEQHFYKNESYIALILLFEVTEYICKSVIGDYDSSFYNVVESLYNKGIITVDEKQFLSTHPGSIRKIRNIFAHANLMGINLVCEQNGARTIYPLTEEESCNVLYEIISPILFNVLLDIIKNELGIGFSVDFGNHIKQYNLKIEKMSSIDSLKMKGFSYDDILKAQLLCNDNTLQRLADNAVDVNMVSTIAKRMSIENEGKD